MKKLTALFILFVLFGCTYEGHTLRDYLEDPRSIIKDPHFAEYKKKRNALESRYLHDEITYAEYVEKMNELDEDYAKEVQQRQEILSQ